VRPNIAIPVHGEARHLAAHARLAESCQVSQTLVIENGDMVRLAPGPAAIVDQVPTGRLGLDGKVLIPLDGTVMRARHRAVWSGAAVATLVLDKAGKLKADPQVTVQGLLDPELDAESLDDVAAAVRSAVAALSGADRDDDAVVKEAARLAVRRTLHASHGKKPVTDVHVVRV